MKIKVNGKELTTTGQLSVAELLAERNLDAARVAVELNRDVLPGDAFATTNLRDGDTLEIVQFVGGG